MLNFLSIATDVFDSVGQCKARNPCERALSLLVREGYGRRSTHEYRRSCMSNCILSKELATY